MTPRRYRHYDLIVAAFVTVLLCSNLIGAAKAAQMDLPFIGTVTFGAGVLFFPISYLFGDILTEVYGYAHDRRAVWCGFAALAFAALMAAVVDFPHCRGQPAQPSAAWPTERARGSMTTVEPPALVSAYVRHC